MCIRWDTCVGDNWQTSPPQELPEGTVVVMALGGVAADWIDCPDSLAEVSGWEHLRGKKLYIQRGVSFLEGELDCPLCGSPAPKRGLLLRDVPIMVVECTSCQQFLFLRRPSGSEAQEDEGE